MKKQSALANFYDRELRRRLRALGFPRLRFDFPLRFLSFVYCLIPLSSLGAETEARARARFAEAKTRAGLWQLQSRILMHARLASSVTALHNPKVSTLLRATRRFYAPADSPGVPQHHFSPMDPSRAVDICIGLARRIDST